MARKTWHEIADVLAARMMNNFFCNNGHQTIDEGLAELCANCQDCDAMRIYWDNGGEVGRKAEIDDAKPIALHEVAEYLHNRATTTGCDTSGDQS